jgi:ABC-type transport system substrate-binding protein
MQYPSERTEHTHDDVRTLTAALLSGQTSRRGFIQRAVALGLSSAAIGGILAACGGETATTVPATSAPASAAPASTAPTAAAGGAATRTAAAPAASTGALSAPSASAAASGGPTKRGGGGTLKLLQWQAPTILNPQLSQGTKDDLACSPVYEPLLSFNIDGNAVAILAAEVPSRENGGVAADARVRQSS